VEWHGPLDLPNVWGPVASCPGRCAHPVVVSVGRIPVAWGRRLERELRGAGVLHWKIPKTPYLPWLPDQTIAMMVIRHVDASEEFDQLRSEMHQVSGIADMRRMIFVMPPELMDGQWTLRENGAAEVVPGEVSRAAHVAQVVRRFFQTTDTVHPDRAVPACWLAPPWRSRPQEISVDDR